MSRDKHISLYIVTHPTEYYNDEAKPLVVFRLSPKRSIGIWCSCGRADMWREETIIGRPFLLASLSSQPHLYQRQPIGTLKNTVFAAMFHHLKCNPPIHRRRLVMIQRPYSQSFLVLPWHQWPVARVSTRDPHRRPTRRDKRRDWQTRPVPCR